MPSGSPPSTVVHLLDGNVLVALADESHVHHERAADWFAVEQPRFSTCPITQGTLIRLAMRAGGLDPATALALLEAITAHPDHTFWTDDLDYARIEWTGVIGHRQVTDAYLAGLARHHGGRLATFDRGLAALHPDVAIAID